jgi:hypothetical protein
MPNIQTTLAYAFGTNTIADTALDIDNAGFSWGATDLANAQSAFITTRTAGVMYTYDGTTPTSSIGHLLAQNDNVRINGNVNINNLSFIREAGVSAELSITLEK